MPIPQRFERRASTEGGQVSPHRWRALLVEDGPLNRQIAKRLLERGSFEVSTAENGVEALEAVRRAEAFDIVLMDLDMPVMDGFAAAAAIRDLDDGRGGVPIVALSALTHGDEVTRARAAGMDGHLAKPFDPGTFVRDVEQLIARGGAGGRTGRDGSGRPVWNMLVLHDLTRRLGAVRINQALLLFESRLARARAILGDPQVSAAQVAFEAHALVSGAGTLGFEDLCAISNEVQRRAAEPGSGRAEGAIEASIADLLDAIERALAQVSNASDRPSSEVDQRPAHSSVA